MLLENLLFFLIATIFLSLMGYYWRTAKPFSIPSQLPNWFRAWFILVQVLGVLLPLIALILWGIWWGNTNVLSIFASYFLILGLQILTETLMLKQFQTVAWVAIPYFYVPYRVWQLYQGLIIIGDNSELMLVRLILEINIAIWMINYCLNLLQLPLLFRWEKE
mgnify:CR=1 FL=1